MWLSDFAALGRRGSALRVALLASVVASLGLTSACTVRPLYADGGTTAGVPGGVMAELSAIAIKPVRTRPAQEVRNHLIFLFNGGGKRTATPAYSMSLVVAPRVEQSVLQSSGEDNEPTAGTVTLLGSYTITDFGKGQVIARGRRQAVASYDIPKQEFAAYRAVIDAENRAARELAQILQLAIAQDFSQLPPSQ